MADASRHNLYAVPEVTYGTTPTTSPAFVDVRHTGCTLQTTKGVTVSEELHEDRQIRDARHGVKGVSGDINFEFSYETFESFLEAVICGTWTTDVLKAGTTRRSFSILRHFADLTGKPYHMFTGCELNTFNLTVPAEGIVTGSFGIVGKGQSLTADLSALTTPTLGDPTTTKPFDAFTGTIEEGGSSLAVATEISLSFANGITPRYVIGSDTTIRPAIGRSNLTGTLTAFFETTSLLEKFLDETESSLEFTLQDLDGNTYEVLLPRIKYTGGPPDVSGEGPVSLALPFQALYDDSAESNIVVTRTDAS